MVINVVMIWTVLCLMATVKAKNKTMEEAAVEAHNKLRAFHNVPMLTLNKGLSILARYYAEGAVFNETMNVTYYQGENAAFKCSPQLPIQDYTGGLFQDVKGFIDVIQDWYNEGIVHGYNYSNDFWSSDTAKFSQLVWKSSDEIGVAAEWRRVGDQYCTYFLALYRPVGNINGSFIENVLKPDVLLNTSDVYELLHSEDEPEPEPEQNLQMGQACLVAHNKLRDIHNVSRMQLNSDMNRKAQEYAVKLATQGYVEHGNVFERDGAGENLARPCSYVNENVTILVLEAVAGWYNELFDHGYDYNNTVFPSFNYATDFTQVVWNDSVELGCGIASGPKDGMTCYYTVVRYKLEGNKMGEFQQNVLKPENPLENKEEVYELLGISDSDN